MTAVLAPFIAAFLLAYLLEPVCRMFVRLGLPRSLASVAAIVVGILMVVLMVAVGLPLVVTEVSKLSDRLPDFVARAYAEIRPYLIELGMPVEDPQALRARLLQWFQGRAGEVSQTVWGTVQSGVGAIFSVVGWIVLVPVVLFYLLKDWLKIFAEGLRLFPMGIRREIESTGGEIHQTLKGYLQGQALVMMAMSVFYAVGLLVADFGNWLSIGLVSGILTAIPYIGFLLGLLIALLSGVLEHGFVYAAIVVLVVYGLGQVLEGFVLTPKLVGDRIGLHPLAVIFALIAFGSMLGFVGVLLALPATAILLVLARRVLKALETKPRPQRAVLLQTPSSDEETGSQSSPDQKQP